MRKILLWLTPMFLLAGCLSDDGGSDADGDSPDTVNPMTNTTLEPLHWEGSVTAALDVTNVVTGVPCGALNSCDMRDFSIKTTVDFTATLSWGVAANDLDLYLYQGDEQISSDGINAIDAVPPEVPTTTQVMHVTGLPPGDYTFWVVPWNAVMESYTLDVTFA